MQHGTASSEDWNQAPVDRETAVRSDTDVDGGLMRLQTLAFSADLYATRDEQRQQEASCASRIADALVTQYIRGQPFHLRLRVAVIAFTTLASFFGLAIGALSISRHLNLPQPRPTYTAPLHNGIVYCVVCLVVMLPSYARLRARGHVSDAHCTATLVLTTVLVALNMLSIRCDSTGATFMGLAVVSTACRLPRASNVLVCVTVVLGSLLSLARRAWPDTLLLPEDSPYDGLSGFIGGFFLLVMVGCVFAFGHTIHAVFEQKVEEVTLLSEQAQASSQLAREVATLLAAYDTTAVEHALETYKNGPLADDQLVASYTDLTENLKMYRPHLPTWMLDDERASQTPAADGDVTVTGRSEAATGAVTGFPPIEVPSDRVYAQGISPRGDTSDGAFGGATPLSSMAGFMPSAAGTAPWQTEWGFRGAATVAMLDFRLRDATDLALRSFIAFVQRLVSDTRGVVHSCIGSTLIVSWGAVKKIGRPEYCAARLFARLRQMHGMSRDVAVSGAAYTGAAEVRLSGDLQHQLLVVETPSWLRILHRLSAFACEHDTFVIDGDAARSVPEVVTQCVASLSPTTAHRKQASALATPESPYSPTREGSLQPTRACEVLSERQPKTDEWLHPCVSRSGSDDNHDTVTRAEAHCCEARFDDAVSLLKEVQAKASRLTRSQEDVPDLWTPAAEHLLAVAEACAGSGADADAYRAAVEGRATPVTVVA